MKEQDIEVILKNKGIDFIQHATIIGTVKANIGAYNNGLGNMMYTMKEHVLHFNGQGVAILAMDDMNGTVNEEKFVWIPNKEIHSIDIKVKFFVFWLEICTEKGDIWYKIRRSVLVAPWHKENLSYLLLKASEEGR